jgi:hypothetical protein
MSARLAGWLAAGLVMLVTLALILLEINDAAVARWWSGHSLTVDTVSGLLVLLITVLVVNQLINMRQAKQRSHVVAGQAAIVMAQANQTAKVVSALTGGSGDQDAASDGFRMYMMILLVSSPAFVASSVARNFLEQAQTFGAVMARRLALIKRSTDGADVPGDVLGDAMKQLQSAAAPLLQPLSPGARDSIQRIGRTAEE